MHGADEQAEYEELLQLDDRQLRRIIQELRKEVVGLKEDLEESKSE